MSKEPSDIKFEVAAEVKMGDDITLVPKSAKSGGAQSAGEFGGIFTHGEGDEKKHVLVKTENPANDITEFIASKIFAKTAPGYGADVRIIDVNPEDGRKVEPYIGSVYFREYVDLMKEVTHEKAPKKDGRVFMAGTVNRFTRFIRKKMLGKDGKPEYTGFPESMATSLLLGDFDVHTGNVGAVGEKGSKKKLVRIDFAAALKDLDDELHPHSHIRHPVGFGPTNHFKEYPRELRLSPEMAEHAMKVGSEDLDKTINESMGEVAEKFSIDSLKQFAKKVGVKKDIFESLSEKKEVKEAISNHLKTKMKARQKSLKNFAAEAAIYSAFDKDGNLKDEIEVNGEKKSGAEFLKGIIEGNPEFFKEAAYGKDVHLRRKDNKSLFGMFDWTGLTSRAKYKKNVKEALVKAYGEYRKSIRSVENPLIKSTDEYNRARDETKKLRESLTKRTKRQFEPVRYRSASKDPGMTI